MGTRSTEGEITAETQEAKNGIGWSFLKKLLVNRKCLSNRDPTVLLEEINMADDSTRNIR